MDKDDGQPKIKPTTIYFTLDGKERTFKGHPMS